MRRTIIIIAGIFLLIAAGIAAYFFLFAGKGTSLVPGNANPFTDTGDAALPSDLPTTQQVGVPIAGAGDEIAPHLVKITAGPVALGSVAVYIPPRPAASSTSTSTPPLPAIPADVRIQFVERQSGNIYGYQAHGRTLTRLTNKTLPGVQEASWLADGSQAYVRFLETANEVDHIDTYALPANGSDGYFLQQDLVQVTTNASSTIFTLVTSANGSTGTLATASGTNPRTLFASALSAIRVAFAGTGFVATTLASSKSDGYAFSIDAKSGSFTRVLGPLPGLTTLPSPSGKFLLYSYLDKGKLYLAVLDLTTHSAVPLPLATIASKCAWTNDSLTVYCGVPRSVASTLPDMWYQGAIAFSDRFWKIDLGGRVAELMFDPKTLSQVDVDAVALSVDRTSDVLVFTNKTDGSLWVYDL